MPNIELIDEPKNTHGKRVDRYQRWKRRTRQMSRFVASEQDEARAQRLFGCHSYLLFRDYFQLGKVRLQRTTSCRLHLLCPMCAIQRAAAAVQRYHERYEILSAQEDYRLYYAVLTAPNGESLSERFTHVERAVRGLVDRRRAALCASKGSKVHAYALNSPFANADGGAYSFEVHRGKGSGLWHPHINLLMLSREGIDTKGFVDEWLSMTGDAKAGGQFCKEISTDDKQAFLEVFKYALKFNTMSIEDTYHAYESLRGRHLFGSFGAFRGVKVPDVPDTEVLTSPYVELLYRYQRGSYQRLPSDGSVINPLPATVNRELIGVTK